MKKSDITITMPLLTFEELEVYKKKYNDLCESLKSCFNTSSVDYDCITFDVNKVMLIAKQMLPLKYKDCYINLNLPT